MKNIAKKMGLVALTKNEEGLEILEYGILAAVIVVVAVVGYEAMGGKILDVITNVTNTL